MYRVPRPTCLGRTGGLPSPKPVTFRFESKILPSDRATTMGLRDNICCHVPRPTCLNLRMSPKPVTTRFESKYYHQAKYQTFDTT
ncbi:hypothetical protein AVEN_223800-1 [Araneus ventricosus]|uniref:Uncharacterized protein n=1 Tax=Araneus ventricosus TaxID=182803 RepID=A0A4Y2DN40_ARAVE|nr:hypothetical protein AVEN_223800-1 [Araneus ventricosus]